MENGSRRICNSFKGSEGLMTLTEEDCVDTKIYIKRAINSAASDAAGLSDQRLSQESRKRNRIVINQSSCLSTTLSVEPTFHIINSASFRDPYRLKLANVFHLLETREVCSGLAFLAEAAALAQASNHFAEVKDAGENKNGDVLEAKEDYYRGGPAQVQKRATDDLNIGSVATNLQEGRALPPGIIGLICKEKLKTVHGTYFRRPNSEPWPEECLCRA
ncbi:hypothetical protein V6N13_015919 [Hibiscus sabdariffa]|uniref:Uncharacterized protein n=1 Tax=Hibiscus sabdariffa TaxID=183260 RepID=A0ABR2CXL7_9ROSI